MTETSERSKLSRRSFLTTGALTAAAPLVAESWASRAEAAEPAPAQPSTSVPMSLTVNGQPRSFAADLRVTLLDALREELGLTGTKKGCDHGQCGACTVHVNGRRVLSCLTLAISAQGKSVTTIEGIAPAGALHPMQQAFIDHEAYQCGYCTSGQIMSGIGCVNEGHATTDADIREYMSGNLCRCAVYPNIVAAIRQAKTEMGRT